MFTALNKAQADKTVMLLPKHFLIYEEAEKRGLSTLQRALEFSLQLSDAIQKTNISLDENFGEKFTRAFKQNLQVKPTGF